MASIRGNNIPFGIFANMGGGSEGPTWILDRECDVKYTPMEKVHDDTPESSAKTKSITITAPGNCILILCVYHRSLIKSISGELWQRIGYIGMNSSDNTQISVYMKHVNEGEYTITVEQNSAVRLGLIAYCLYNVTEITLVQAIKYSMPSSRTWTPKVKESKRRLYLVAAETINHSYGQESNSDRLITITDVIPNTKAIGCRFGGCYDASNIDDVPIFNFQSTGMSVDVGNPILTMIFDIQ